MLLVDSSLDADETTLCILLFSRLTKLNHVYGIQRRTLHVATECVVADLPLISIADEYRE